MPGFEVTIGYIADSDLPDIVICYQYYRLGDDAADIFIGLDLNSTGYVTGGWSQVKSMPWIPDESLELAADITLPHQHRIGIAELRPNMPSIVLSGARYLEHTSKKRLGKDSNQRYELILIEDVLEGMHYEDKDVLTAERDVLFEM